MMNEGFTTVCNEYRQWLTTLGFSRSLCYHYSHSARDFFEWLQAQNIHALSLATQKHISTYFEYLQTRKNKRTQGGLSTSHLNHNFDAVDKLLEFLHQMGMSGAPIPTTYRIKQDQQARIEKIEPFTPEEIKELIAQIPATFAHYNHYYRETKTEQLKLVFALYYGCGLRRMEGYKLTASDIDFERRTVFVRQGKGYKDRIVPMNAGVYAVLQDYIYNFRNLQKPNHSRLFLSTTGTLNNSLHQLHEASENEAIRGKRITLHTLRHSIATHLMQNGMSIESIALFLGHSTLESTQVYTHFL